MKVILAFCLEHNVPEAVRQEYELAREHFDTVRTSRNVFNRDHTERYQAARHRLNRAREMMWHAWAHGE